jgi:hypothetical protein
MASFAGVDVSYGAVFALMRPTDDFALRTVFEFAWLFRLSFLLFHCAQRGLTTPSISGG